MLYCFPIQAVPWLESGGPHAARASRPSFDFASCSDASSVGLISSTFLTSLLPSINSLSSPSPPCMLPCNPRPALPDTPGRGLEAFDVRLVVCAHTPIPDSHLGATSCRRHPCRACCKSFPGVDSRVRRRPSLGLARLLFSFPPSLHTLAALAGLGPGMSQEEARCHSRCDSR